MRSYRSTDLKQNLGDVLDIASREPIAITRHSKPRFVLMSVEAYEARFAADTRRSYGLDEMPDEHLEMLEAALTKSAKDSDRD